MQTSSLKHQNYVCTANHVVMKKTFSIILISFFSLVAIAGGGEKNATAIKGVVTDFHGEPLAGAKVHVKTTNQVVYTDFDGNFIVEGLSPAQEHQLELSHISFQKQTKGIDLNQKGKAQFLQISLKSK